MYLKGRWRTMIDSNPGGAMATAAFEKNGIVGQVPRAARLVSASLGFLQKVLNGSLQPDVFKVPLDMQGYTRMFASSRVAKADRDVLVQSPAASVGHIVVFRGNEVYTTQVRDSHGNWLSVDAIERELQRVVEAS